MFLRVAGMLSFARGGLRDSLQLCFQAQSERGWAGGVRKDVCFKGCSTTWDRPVVPYLF